MKGRVEENLSNKKLKKVTELRRRLSCPNLADYHRALAPHIDLTTNG
jgi:hypothetical protein